MTSKQRAYLKGLAQTMEPIFQIGKKQSDTGKYKSNCRGTGSQRADQDQCSAELYGTIRRSWQQLRR